MFLQALLRVHNDFWNVSDSSASFPASFLVVFSIYREGLSLDIVHPDLRSFRGNFLKL